MAQLAVVERLEPAAEAGLVQLHAGNAAGMFAHALVRESLLSELRSARRTRLHWLVGRAWAQRVGAAPAVIAHHLCEGSLAGDVGAAVAAALDAATAALRVGASEDQLTWAVRALELLADEPSTFPVLHNRALFHRGHALQQSAQEETRATADLVAAASLALERGDHLLALSALVPALKVPFPDPAAIALAKRAVAEIPSETVLGGIARTMHAHLDGTRGLPFDIAESETLVAALGDEIPVDLVMQVHDSFLDLVHALPDLERTERACSSSLVLGDRWSYPNLSGTARIGLASVAARRGEREAFELERDRIRDITRVGRFRIVESYDVALAVADGRLDEAEVLARAGRILWAGLDHDTRVRHSAGPDRRQACSQRRAGAGTPLHRTPLARREAYSRRPSSASRRPRRSTRRPRGADRRRPHRADPAVADRRQAVRARRGFRVRRGRACGVTADPENGAVRRPTRRLVSPPSLLVADLVVTRSPARPRRVDRSRSHRVRVRPRAGGKDARSAPRCGVVVAPCRRAAAA